MESYSFTVVTMSFVVAVIGSLLALIAVRNALEKH